MAVYARDYQPLPLFEFSVGTDASRDYSSLTACFAALNNTLVDKANSKVIITVYNDTGTDKWYCDTSTVTLNIPSNCIDFVLTVDDDSWHKGQYDKGCIIQLQSTSSNGCFLLNAGNNNRILIERLAFDANNQIGGNAFLPSIFVSSNSSVSTGYTPIPPNSLKNLYVRGGDGTTADNVRAMRGISTSARHFLVDSCIVENLVCSGGSTSYGGIGINVYFRSQIRNCTVNNVEFQNTTGTNIGIYGATNYGNTENCIVTNVGAGAGLSECYLSSMINLSNCVADDTTGTTQSTASTEFVDHANSDYKLNSGASAAGVGYSGNAIEEDITGQKRKAGVARDAGAFNNIAGYDADPAAASSGGGGGGSSTPTAGTQVYPFRQFVEADFGSAGGGATLHPLRSN